MSRTPTPPATPTWSGRHTRDLRPAHPQRSVAEPHQPGPAIRAHRWAVRPYPERVAEVHQPPQIKSGRPDSRRVHLPSLAAAAGAARKSIANGDEVWSYRSYSRLYRWMPSPSMSSRSLPVIPTSSPLPEPGTTS